MDQMLESLKQAVQSQVASKAPEMSIVIKSLRGLPPSLTVQLDLVVITSGSVEHKVTIMMRGEKAEVQVSEAPSKERVASGDHRS
jgi:hypothetical protein